MPQTVHELAIELQGEVDSKFGSTINEVHNSLKQLDAEVKQIGDGNKGVDGLSAQFVRLDHDSILAAREAAKLNMTLKNIDGFDAQRRAAIDAANGLRCAQARVRELERANKESGGKELAKELKAAKREAVAAERAYKKQKTALAAMSKKLQDAGVDTKHIADEQKRLGAEAKAAAEKVKRLGDEMSAIVRHKSTFADLKKNASAFAADMKGIAKGLAMLKGAMLAVGAAGYTIASSTAAAGDAAAKTAGKLHMGVEAFQELDYAASLSGVKDFPGMMMKMNAQLAKAASGGGEAAKVMKGLGLNADQFAKMRPEIAVQVLADELNKIKDPAARARAEMALFGKSGAEMGQFLSIGSDGMRELMKEARETGGVISEETARQAEAFNDARDRMVKTFEGLKNTIGAEFIPIFTDIFKEIADFFIQNRDVVKEFAKDMADRFREFLPTLRDAIKNIGVFFEKLIAAKDTVKSFGKALVSIVAIYKIVKTALDLGKMISSVKALTAGVQGTVGVFGALKAVVLANPIGAALAAIAAVAYLVISNWSEVKAFFQDLGEKIVGVMSWVEEQVEAVFSLMPEGIRGIVEPIFDIMTAPFRAVWHVIKTIWRAIKGDFASFGEFIGELFGGLYDTIVAPFKKAFEWISDAWGSLKSWLGMGPEINAEVNAGDLGGYGAAACRARGGIVTQPTLTNIAERGAEAIIPLTHQDRARGLAMLDTASRALGAAPRGGMSATFTMPPITVNISGSGETDTGRLKETIIETMREVGARLVPEWAEQIERCAYGTA